MNFINTEKLILASSSPRREALLRQIGMDIKISPANIDESKILTRDPEEHVKELSFLKADKTARSYPDDWILGADTIVVVQDQILGKPQSSAQAIAMLSRLNDGEHSVYTGFCILHSQRKILISQAIETKVIFKPLSQQEIKWYVNTGEPFDKAGAYAIQGIGAFLVKGISGSYTNVVGLPVCELVETLNRLNIIQFKDLNHHAVHQR